MGHGRGFDNWRKQDDSDKFPRCILCRWIGHDEHSKKDDLGATEDQQKALREAVEKKKAGRSWEGVVDWETWASRKPEVLAYKIRVPLKDQVSRATAYDVADAMTEFKVKIEGRTCKFVVDAPRWRKPMLFHGARGSSVIAAMKQGVTATPRWGPPVVIFVKSPDRAKPIEVATWREPGYGFAGTGGWSVEMPNLRRVGITLGEGEVLEKLRAI